MACEESKFGLKTDEVEKLVRDVAKLPHLRVKGLMTIAKLEKHNHHLSKMLKKTEIFSEN